MKNHFLLILIVLLSCNSAVQPERLQLKSKTEDSVGMRVAATPISIEKREVVDTQVIETFIDSLNIGVKGKCKIELIKYSLNEDNFLTINFYLKEQKSWQIQNRYSYETNALMEFQPIIYDYNNDGFNDITFISGTAVRGANEIRRLFIYNNRKQKLISIVNSEDYPNMEYNKERDCIDAFMVHGASSTVFAKIVGDSLKTFAIVSNSMEYTTVDSVDELGNYMELYKVESKGMETRFKNFKPLIEYKNKR